MKEILYPLLTFLCLLLRLLRQGGAKSIVAENLLLKQQLVIVRRHNKKSRPMLSTDRISFLITIFMKKTKLRLSGEGFDDRG